MAVEQLIKQQGARTEEQYRRRVLALAAIYFVLNLVCLLVIFIVAWRVKLWITISQRSNVETLTFAFIFVLFLYLYITSFRGAWGAMRIFWRNGIKRMLGRNTEQLECEKQAALHTCDQEGHRRAYTDVQIVRNGDEARPIIIPLRDAAGSLGELRINGVRLYLKAEVGGISNSIFEYIVNQVEQAVNQCAEQHSNEEDDEGAPIEINIVAWQSVDEEEAVMYYHQVEAFRRLARKLDEEQQFWPTIRLHEGDVEYLKARLREVIPTLRDETLLPDVEYSAEYRIPIIPEPLGFVSLSRNEKRADPIATMGCAMVVVIAMAALLLYFIYLPPWVPGK